MIEEATRNREELLSRMPDLKRKDDIIWNEEGTGKNFISLCALLKGNEIRASKLDLSSVNHQ